MRERLRRAAVVDTTGGVPGTPPSLVHLLHRVPGPGALYNTFTRLLAALRPTALLSFHNSAASMEALEAHLRAKRVRCGVLGNAYSNATRAGALAALASGGAQVLLATEMAARGLDLPRLSHVVNFDPPSSLREYVHRAGRVGRLSSLTPGRAGTVLTLVTADEEETQLLQTASQLGVALGELTLAAGVPSVRPILAPPADLDGHRKNVLRHATKLRLPDAGARNQAAAPAATSSLP